MDLTYKIATMDDLDVLTSTRIIVLRAANGLDASTDMSQVEVSSYDYYRSALADQAHIAILVYDGDHIVGTGGISFFTVMPTFHNPSGKKAYIMNMYTRPDYRRRGIAYHTLELLVSMAKERGITHITLEATNAGRPLYEKFGFIKMNNELELP